MTVELGQAGIHLERFSRENADLVLSWRNHPDVRAYSLNDSVTSRDDHLAFVDGLADRTDRHFFIVHLNGKPEAVINVNLDGTEGLWGCYLCDQGTPRPGLFPVLVAISGGLAFGPLGCTALKSEVVVGNSAPEKLNAFLGVPPDGRRTQARPTGEDIEVLLYRIEAENWPAIRIKIDKIVTRALRSALAEFDADPTAAMI